MRRKAVSQRLRSVAEVRASIHTHRGTIGGQLDERQPPPSGEASFSQLYFDYMDAELASVELNLVSAEDEHVRRLVRIAQLRRQRDDLTASVYQKQVAARQILAGLYGADRDFELAAISGRTPLVPQALCPAERPAWARSRAHRCRGVHRGIHRSPHCPSSWIR